MIRLFISIGRVFRTGIKNFARNLWLSMAATAIMVVTLVIILSTFAINNATKDTLQQAAEDITISIFLTDDITEEQRLEFQNDLQMSPDVTNVFFTSKDQALENYLRDNADTGLAIATEFLDENPLQASFEVELTQLSQNQNLLNLINSDLYSDVIDDFNSERLERASRVGNLQDFIITAGLLAAGVFALISVLVIFNTIRLAIFTRSNEIQIMKLIGSTNNFIRGPFLVEAGIYGLLSGVISLSLVYSVMNRLSASGENGFITILPTAELFSERVWLISTSTIAGGVLIGVVSSLLAMSRYLRLHSKK
ncbi:TPA: ABC transporter permease [Candidatus Saccharibacteria bacterium]|nr:ABC transporter permease [Candidatus Saccharibacteria bacterium]HIO87543.1 ABC transporter permease [Candidatus Saccharibacteria bacterium]